MNLIIIRRGLSLMAVAALLSLQSLRVYADQPIMNMMPRWAGGYGIQLFYEREAGDDLFSGSGKTANPFGEEFEKDILHIEGVYTFTRAVRVVFKQPWVVNQSRTVERDGRAVRETGSGLDDLTLGLPLKKYFNGEGYSGNWSVNPAIHVPTGDDSDAYPVADGSWDVGLSLGWERETVHWFSAFSAGAWWNGEEDKYRREWHASLDLGWNATDRFTLYAEIDPSWYEGRELTPDRMALQAGPAAYYRFSDVWHGRVEYKTPLYEDIDGTALTDGSAFRIGLGGVW